MSGVRADRGFTLLEVLVALVIFALLLGVLARIFQAGLCQSAVAEQASSRARLGTACAGTPQSRSCSRRPRSRACALLVAVSVAWGARPGKQVPLATLRLGTLPR